MGWCMVWCIMGDVWVPGGEDVVMLCGGGGKKCMCVLPGLLYLHKIR